MTGTGDNETEFPKRRFTYVRKSQRSSVMHPVLQKIQFPGEHPEYFARNKKVEEGFTIIP
jgi:hypothetical protein